VADAGDPDQRAPQIRRLGARYVRRVTRADRGARVSVRHLRADPQRGPIPTDVVGRLIGIDDELLFVVDRDGRLHLVRAADVLASRVVPPHPRLPPEPDVGHREAPAHRHAARCLVLDPSDRVLLVAHVPAPGQRVWTAPGGGLDAGESHEQAARRELHEEIGLDLAPGPWVWSRRETFPWRGVWIDQEERWLLVRAPEAVDPATAPLVDPGTTVARWWSVAELAATDDVLAPRAIAEHLARLLREGPPPTPIDVGR
jgi:8-oxo-dGTP pyrophosphatase MutT (NUDIX family)